MNWLNQLLIVSLRADFLCSLKINQTNSNNIDVQQKRLDGFDEHFQAA